MVRTDRICFSCWTPLAERAARGGVRYGDGHSLCGPCWETSVDSPTTGIAVLAQVRRLVTARTGLDFTGIATPLVLDDRPSLASESCHSTKPIGLCCYGYRSTGGRVNVRHIEAIKILHGLPREHFSEICAHELGHAYMFMNEFPELDRRTEEGLCRLNQYVYLAGERTEIAKRRMKATMQSRDPIYGDGFRAAYRCLGNRRVVDLYSYVKRTGRFPSPGTRW